MDIDIAIIMTIMIWPHDHSAERRLDATLLNMLLCYFKDENLL